MKRKSFHNKKEILYLAEIEALRILEKKYGFPESYLTLTNLEYNGIGEDEYRKIVKEIIKEKIKKYPELKRIFFEYCSKRIII